MNFSNQYPLKPFQQRDLNKIRQVIAEYPLATLISQNEDFPTVSQVPLVFDDAVEKLLGHFDKNNPHCAHILEGGNIYGIFNGPNQYMTPTIYPNEQYPGWNYVAVHVKGIVKSITNEKQLTDILLKIATQNEPKGSSYQLLPAQKNFDLFLTMILGFEIEILDIKGVFKLAQDKGAPHVEIARDYLAKMSQKDILNFLKEILD